MTQLENINNSVIAPEEFEAPAGVIETEAFKLTRVHWALIALAALSLLFILFITIARSIQIATVTVDLNNPDQFLSQPATVNIASLIKLPIGNRTLVLPGTHTVTATAEGFETLNQDIEIAADRHQQIELVLQRLPGNLDISLLPDVGARVSIDGQPVGELPGLINNIPAGQHDITIDAPLYRTAQRSIIVAGKGQTENLEFTLDPAWGTVTLDSLPSQATVKIDDEVVGQTPLEIKVEEGSHTLTLEADKFKPFSQDFTIFAQQELQVPPIELIPADGILEVATTPSSAAVILNGEYRGVSPITLNLKPDQLQQLQIYRAGYRLQTQAINLAPAQRETQQVSLQQDATAVRFSITPSDAMLYVDGVRLGAGSRTVNLNTLPHRISVRKPGYVNYENTLIPTKSSSQVVSIKLLTKAEHFWANVPDRYDTSEDHSMVLFKSPGKVKMGSSRRETGRRSNETEYTATLTKHFYVSKHEVTNKQFRQFDPGHNSGNYKRKSLDSNKHPVANVSWQEAAKYCNWLSKKENLTPFYTTKAGFIAGQNPEANGYRLLTEAEWAWLARNNDGQVKTYPWENDPLEGGKPVGNFADINAAEFIAFTMAEYDDGYKASAPIGRFPANHRGLYDMAGNAAEWVNDWYSANSDLAGGQNLVDPLGPDIGEFHVIRGASWARGHLPQLRLAYRDFGAKGKHDVGFRIARYVGKPE